MTIDSSRIVGRRHARGTLSGAMLAAALILGACAPNMHVLRPVTPVEARRVDLCAEAGACRDSVKLTYLGVGGFVVRHGERAVLTAPSFTHRSLFKVLLPWPYRFGTDTALVDERLQSVDLRGTGAILVGHAHYDHLLDVPYVARRWVPASPIYGSPTMAHTLSGEPTLRERVASVADSVGDAGTLGRWIYADGGGIRFMPLRSTHPPNWWKYTFARGSAEEPRTSLPRTARGWRMGEVYAWIVDIVAPDSTPLFRIYYQDSAADSASLTLPPFAGRDARGVDLAVLCVGNYGRVKNNPDLAMRALRPRYVVLGHWEDFFRGAGKPLQVIRFTDTERLVERLQAGVGERWLVPEPMAQVTFRY